MAIAPLHVHSAHSLLDGLPTIPQLVARASALGYPALALTDVNSMAGCILFLQECRRVGIRPILGVELRDHRDPDLRLVLLARNAAGYGDLCELTSFHMLERRGPSLEDLFARPFPDLVALCPHPELLQRLAHTPLRQSLSGAIALHDIRSASRSRAIEAVCRTEGLRAAVAHETWFLEPHEHELHRVLRAIAHNTDLSRLHPSACAPEAGWLVSPAQLRERYGHLPEALAHAEALSLSCRDDLVSSGWILPHIEVPEGHTPITWLSKLAHAGLLDNYGGKPEWVRAHALQEKELAVIERTGYASYFLMVREIREFAAKAFAGGYRRARECSIMRGSAANCLTFYNIGASDLDPIRYDLYFERFLNESRTSPPDADLDFGWDERAKALEWFFETYGEDRVCVLSATHHFRRRAAFRETAKVLGFSEAQVNHLYDRLRREPLRPDTHWLDRVQDIDPSLAPVARLAELVRGRPHFLGQHPGGVIVTNDPIWRHAACQRSGGSTNRVISQMDMHAGIEFLGLVKFDILGNGSLSVLRDSLAMLEGQGVPDPRVWDLETVLHDPAVLHMLSGGDARGVFYLESPAQIRLNRRAGIASFEDVGITSSLVRPAGTAYAERFVQRHQEALRAKHETNPEREPSWQWLHPSLRGILEDSHDVCVFQEDVTRICVEVAGMTFAEADRVRKMMNSAHEGEPPDYHLTALRFQEGCRSTSGLSAAQASELWERVASFRGFSFCKSHSLSYAQLSFRCAYVKSRWPAVFWASVIANDHGFYPTSAYVDEARRAGIRILPWDINASGWKWTGGDDWMRPGFQHVKGLRQASIDAMVGERASNGLYGDLADFLARVPMSRGETELLVRVGAFDGLGSCRTHNLAWLAELGHRRAPARGSAAEGTSLDLFATQGMPSHILRLPMESATDRCLEEQKLAGFASSGDVFEGLARLGAQHGAIAAARLPEFVGKSVRVVGIPVAQRVHRVARSGERMLFLTLSDPSGLLDAVLWPEAYKRYHAVASCGGILVLQGNVTAQDNTHALDTQRVEEIR